MIWRGKSLIIICIAHTVPAVQRVECLERDASFCCAGFAVHHIGFDTKQLKCQLSSDEDVYCFLLLASGNRRRACPFVAGPKLDQSTLCAFQDYQNGWRIFHQINELTSCHRCSYENRSWWQKGSLKTETTIPMCQHC